jgi:hypothetical protein
MVAVNVHLSERDERHVEKRLGHAEQIRSTVRACADDLARLMDLDPKLAVINDRIKAFDRACAKVAAPDRNDADFYGIRLGFESPRAITLLRALEKPYHPLREKWAQHGVTIQRDKDTGKELIDDYHAKPKSHGYIAHHITLNVTGNNGWKESAEIQVVHRSIEPLYKKTEPYYDLYRQVRERASIQGRDRETLWLPEERAILVPLQKFIRASFEERAWAANLIQLRDTPPHYRNQQLASDDAALHAMEASDLLHTFRAFDGDTDDLVAQQRQILDEHQAIATMHDNPGFQFEHN